MDQSEELSGLEQKYKEYSITGTYEYDKGTTIKPEPMFVSVKVPINKIPGEIVKHLDLKKPRYRNTAAYGHFGRVPDKDGSFSALLPAFFVIPKAVKILLFNFGGFKKNSVSTGFAPGHPPSM